MTKKIEHWNGIQTSQQKLVQLTPPPPQYPWILNSLKTTQIFMECLFLNVWLNLSKTRILNLVHNNFEISLSATLVFHMLRKEPNIYLHQVIFLNVSGFVGFCVTKDTFCLWMSVCLSVVNKKQKIKTPVLRTSPYFSKKLSFCCVTKLK